jgi:hypothetical protein
MEENITFYDFITKLNKKAVHHDNIKHNMQMLCESIIKDYKKNIQIAAEHNFKTAILFIYQKNAILHNLEIDKYIFPSPEVEQMLKQNEICTVKNFLNYTLYPFVIMHKEAQIGETNYVLILAKW